MKKKYILILSFLISFACYSQEKDVFLTEINISVNSAFFERSKSSLDKFIKKSSSKIIRIDEQTTSMTAEFFMKEEYLKELDSLVNVVGFLRDKNLTTSSFNAEIKRLDTELEYLEQKQKAYETELKTITQKDTRYYDYWQELRNIEKRVFEIKNEKITYQGDKAYRIIFSIYDDTVDFTAGDINWVNMPGASFDMLFVENPVSNVSASQYMGYSMKYLITRGKSHFSLGALKEFSTEVEDSTRYSELFHFGFGQDFYTKHFGRGKRKWLNLYSGYNVGGIFATGQSTKSLIPYADAYLGLEIFKNQYILFDNKVGYFIPFRDNRNLRGISYNFSFNFVF